MQLVLQRAKRQKLYTLTGSFDIDSLRTSVSKRALGRFMKRELLRRFCLADSLKTSSVQRYRSTIIDCAFSCNYAKFQDAKMHRMHITCKHTYIKYRGIGYT